MAVGFGIAGVLAVRRDASSFDNRAKTAAGVEFANTTRNGAECGECVAEAKSNQCAVARTGAKLLCEQAEALGSIEVVCVK